MEAVVEVREAVLEEDREEDPEAVAAGREEVLLRQIMSVFRWLGHNDHEIVSVNLYDQLNPTPKHIRF